MSLVTLTAVMGIIVTAIGIFTVPALMARKADKEKIAATANVTFEKLNLALDRQNEKLEERIQLLQEEHAREVTALKQKYDADLQQANRRIRELEAEQLKLLRRLTSLDGDG